MGSRTQAATLTTLTLAVTALLPPALSAQGSYQIELTTGYSWSENDTTPEISLTSIPFRGKYHLEPVALGNHPWNEAAFLEHSMYASAELGWSEFEVGSASADGVLFGGGFRFAKKDEPINGEVKLRLGTLSGSGVDVDITELDVSVGYWLENNMTVGFAIEYEELDPDGAFVFEETSFKAFGKIVQKLDGEAYLNAEAHIGFAIVDTGSSDTNFEVTLEGDYYFTPQYSAGAILDLSIGDAVSTEGTTLGVRGSAWFNPKFGARLQLSKFFASDSAGADEDSLGIFFTARF